MAKLTFTGEIDQDVELLQQLLANLPPAGRERAKQAAITLEKAVNQVRRDYPRDPAAGLGLAFALFLTAQKMIESERDGESKPLIQLI